MKRFCAAVGTVLASSLINVATALPDGHPIGWWVISVGGALLIGATAIQWWLSSSDSHATSQEVYGTSVGGSLRQKMRVTGLQSVKKSHIDGDLDQEQGRPS